MDKDEANGPTGASAHPERVDGEPVAILIAGPSCVGKTTVGEALARSLGVPFEDLDEAVERQLGAAISRLQQRYRTMDRYREAAAGVLANVLRAFDGRSAVIALPPSGLMGPYWRQIRGRSAFTVVLDDSSANILERITFYDDDSRSVEKALSPRERAYYLREIRADMAYFGPSYRKADARVDMAGCSVSEAVDRIRDVLRKALGTTAAPGPSGSVE